MRRRSAIFAALAVTMLLGAAPTRAADEQARQSYVAAVEPICKRDRAATEQILEGARERINRGKLALAGRQLVRASQRFGKTLGQLVGVRRPAADEAKLRKWFKFLRIVQERLRMTGVFYKRGQKLRATHESIRAEKSGNAANNVGFAFGFRYCRMSRARFS